MSTLELDPLLELFELSEPEELYRVVVGEKPSAGAEISVTVPGGVIWIPQALTTRLTTNATVASRVPVLTYDDGESVFARMATTTVVTATQAPPLSWLAMYGTAIQPAGGKTFSSPLVPLLLPSGYRIRTQTDELQATDQYDAPVLYVKQVSVTHRAYRLRERMSQLLGVLPETPYTAPEEE